MKLLVLFNKDIEISPEKVCIHTAHSSRSLSINAYGMNSKLYWKWNDNEFKTVLLKDKITDGIKNKILDSNYFSYEIYDAGLDGVFEKGTVLGYAILIPKDDETFKRLRTLKFESKLK